MFAAMADAYKVQQVQNISLSPYHLWYMATLGGARVLSLDAETGSLERGKSADFLVLKLDADYLEAAAAVSQKVYEQLQRIRQGGGLSMPATRGAARLRLPGLPWLGGAGPIAWRQVLISLRTSRCPIGSSSDAAWGSLRGLKPGPWSRMIRVTACESIR